MIDLFNRWEQVWNDGKFDMASSCVADSYIRHDPKGDRTVSRDAYTAEVAKIHEDRPGIRVVVYDHSFIGNAPGSGSLSNGQTRKAARRKPKRAYRFTGSQAANSRRLGLVSYRQARSGRMPRRSRIGQAHRRSSSHDLGELLSCNVRIYSL